MVVVGIELGSTGMVVVGIELGSIGTVVVVGAGTSGTGALAWPGGVAGTTGKRSARVVGRQAAWAGAATAKVETRAAQAKKRVINRFVKVWGQATPASPQSE
jgi:hypothetical protein